MKTLIELRQVITKHKIKNLSLLIKPSKKQSQTLIQNFYERLNDKDIEMEQEMLLLLYDSPSKHLCFQKLKENIKERMLNIISFLIFSQDKYRDRGNARASCYRNLTACKILKRLHAYQTMANMAKKVLEKALYYELTKPSIEASKLLYEYYSTREYNIRLSKKYYSTLQKQLKNNYLEAKIHNIRRQATTLYEANRSKFKEVNILMEGQIQLLLKMTKQINTIEAIISTASSMLYAYANSKHLKDRILICEQALQKLDQKPFPVYRGRLTFSLNLTLCCILKKDFQKAKNYLDEAIKNKNKLDFNWLKTIELYNLLYLRSAQYDKALEVIQEVYAEEETLQRQKEHTREIWYINRAYVEFLLRAGLIADNGKPRPSFRLSTFMNDVPHFSKDKQGLNLNILILQFLHQLIDERKHDRLIDRTESLRQYAYRYLDELPRPRLFIKMLCTIPEADFDPRAIQKRAQRWLDELRQHPLELADQPFEIELIPFEKLWDMAIDILKM